MNEKARNLVLGIAVLALATTSIAQAKPETSTKKEPKAKITRQKKKSIKKGSLIFRSHCAACHRLGLNQAKPSKPIVDSATLATFATFKANLNKPVGNMPHYEHLINDDKLLKNLYDYCKTLKNENAAPAKGKSKSGK